MCVKDYGSLPALRAMISRLDGYDIESQHGTATSLTAGGMKSDRFRRSLNCDAISGAYFRRVAPPTPFPTGNLLSGYAFSSPCRHTCPVFQPRLGSKAPVILLSDFQWPS